MKRTTFLIFSCVVVLGLLAVGPIVLKPNLFSVPIRENSEKLMESNLSEGHMTSFTSWRLETSDRNVLGNVNKEVHSHEARIPIWLSDYEILPQEIELQLGQWVILDVFNIGSQHQDFTIGRNVIYDQAGNPIGFETDFFRSGGALDTYTLCNAIELHEVDEEDDEFWIGREQWLEGGHPWDYQGFMVILPADYSRFLIRKQQEWFIDDNIGAHSVASLEFRVTVSMLGEWEYVSFAGNGEFYQNGARGRLSVKSP